MAPGSTIARWLAGSMAMMRRIRDVTISTPSACGSAPPDRPVPEPLATNGTFAAAHARTTAATSSAVRGSTTSAGVTRCEVRPSHS